MNNSVQGVFIKKKIYKIDGGKKKRERLEDFVSKLLSPTRLFKTKFRHVKI